MLSPIRISSMQIIWLIFTVTVLLSAISGYKQTYHNHVLIRARPRNQQHVVQLLLMETDQELNLDFWTEPMIRSYTDIRIPPNKLTATTQRLKRMRIPYRIAIRDVQTLLQNDVRSKRNAHEQESSSPVPSFVDVTSSGPFLVTCGVTVCNNGMLYFPMIDVVGKYARYQQVVLWMQQTAFMYPNIASMETVGKSSEGRDLVMMKIGKPYNRKIGQKPAIWIDGGVHAREWISIAVAVMLIANLTQNYGFDTQINAMVDIFDWYILPIANPDGYEYSHDVDRLWRKTRSIQAGGCVGVDPNRNFDIAFGALGSSFFPCSPVYSGMQPFSEPEAAAIRNAVLAIQTRNVLTTFISLHSYSQKILTPFGFTRLKPDDYFDLYNAAIQGSKAIKSLYGRDFEVGAPADIMYLASGGSKDWAKVRANIKYSYTIELRPERVSRGRGQRGFLLPESEILPCTQEVFAAILVFARNTLAPQSSAI